MQFEKLTTEPDFVSPMIRFQDRRADTFEKLDDRTQTGDRTEGGGAERIRRLTTEAKLVGGGGEQIGGIGAKC